MTTIDITAPQEQEGTRAVLRGWLKRDGERVDADEPVCELETDKVLVEVAAPGSGLLQIAVQPDAEVAPGAVLGHIRVEDGQPARDTDTGARIGGSAATSHENGNGTAAAAALARVGAADVKTSPSVRRLLAEHGIDPHALTGSGRGGRVTREDVMAEIDRRSTAVAGSGGATASGGTGASPAASHAPAHSASSRPAGTATPAGTAAARTVPSSATAATGPAGTRIPHDTMRRRIAEHMRHSLTVAPHVTAIFELDFSAIIAHRRAHKEAYARRGVNLTFTAYFVAAAVQAMRAVPQVNSRWHDDALEVFADVNIGIGTALGDKGLIVPVLHKAQELTLEGIAGRLQTLTELARTGKLKPADVQGGTFTISNHGVSGSLLAAPIIINQPQSAILGIGALEKRVVAVEQPDGSDAIAIRPMAYVSLSIDHRVIDGAQTNAWLSRFVQVLREWPAEG